MPVNPGENLRILIVDDNREIHTDFQSVLGRRKADELGDLETSLFGDGFSTASRDSFPDYQLGFATQGQEGVQLAKEAAANNLPYAVAFVDMRMPPGWDGLVTIQNLWKVDPRLEIVLCTAYSDLSWQGIVEELGFSDQLLILKKPFEVEEIRQLAMSLTTKWRFRRDQMQQFKMLENSLEQGLEDLRQAEISREAAIQGNRAKSEFLANISHEIRTPLNGIAGMLQLIEPTDLNRSQQNYLKVAHTSVDCLTTLIQGILDFSKIEAGKMELDEFDFDLQKMISETLEMLAPNAEAKGLRLRCDAPANWGSTYRGDGHRLRQVFINLLNNAIKFTHQGQVTLRILPEKTGGSQSTLRFEIVDTGIGIPPDRKERLFQPFSQVDASTTRLYGGTGLGLALCKRLVEAMQGEIGCESTPEQGSTFWFTVCLKSNSSVPAAGLNQQTNEGTGLLTDSARAVANTNNTAVQSLRILVAEDNDINQFVIKEFLNREGAECTIAVDGEQTIQQLSTSQFDLVLMDCQMPAMDGYETARRIRAMESRGQVFSRNNSRIPIVALTANALFGDRELCLEAGMDEYLTKPVDRKNLRNVLAQFGHVRSSENRSLSSQSVTNATSCFDEAELLDRCFGDYQTAIELVDYFITGLPSNLENLTQACEQHDQKRLLAITHAIKGVAGYLSANNLHRLTADFHHHYRHQLDCPSESMLADANQIRTEAERCLANAAKLRHSLVARNPVVTSH